ncbi:MAG: gliding motility lipoprotein GldH [Bacteroidales bacterium]|nr:gliding motility lipoprotein GldH [Bacteroidales bacterium]MDP3003580.1 gliding motility lipoprotein GldH [Bacteroidales bacterium]
MIKGINRYSFVLILTSLVLLSSCNSNVVYTDSLEMPERTWKLLDIPAFKIPVTDTLNSNNVFFTIRTGSSYPFRNIYLFVTTTSPDGKSITDTLQYNLADEKGKWYGKGFGDIHELNLPYKTNVYFPVKGSYQFKIQHGMRVEDLKGVYDFGLRIEKISK